MCSRHDDPTGHSPLAAGFDDYGETPRCGTCGNSATHELLRESGVPFREPVYACDLGATGHPFTRRLNRADFGLEPLPRLGRNGHGSALDAGPDSPVRSTPPVVGRGVRRSSARLTAG